MQPEHKEWDYSGYPPELRLLLELLGGDIDELFLSLLAGELGLLPWQAEMELLLGRYHLATFLKGAGLKKVSENQMKYIMNVLAEQFEYLDNFTKTMMADIKALLLLPEKERPPLKTVLEKYKTRAGMYGRAASQEYWTGVTGGVPLPAMPGDGSSQCLTSCKCSWLIQPIDAKNGDFNAYWKMGDAEHCQTCQVRAADWNPLRIRNWEYRLPSQRVLTGMLAEEVAEAGVGAEVKSRHKHLPGQHPQKRHGLRGGEAGIELSLAKDDPYIQELADYFVNLHDTKYHDTINMPDVVAHMGYRVFRGQGQLYEDYAMAKYIESKTDRDTMVEVMDSQGGWTVGPSGCTREWNAMRILTGNPMPEWIKEVDIDPKIMDGYKARTEFVQEMFRKKYGEEENMYRGVKGTYAGGIKKILNKRIEAGPLGGGKVYDRNVECKMRGLSSWTPDSSWARAFAGANKGYGRGSIKGVVLSRIIKAKDVWLMPRDVGVTSPIRFMDDAGEVVVLNQSLLQLLFVDEWGG